MKRLALIVAVTMAGLAGCEMGPEFTNTAVNQTAVEFNLQEPQGIAIPSSQNTVNVSTISDLQKAISAANPGTEIVLADGVYTTTAQISIGKAGTAENPIVIRAASVGGAEIKGKAGFSFEMTAAYVIIEGFKFTHSTALLNMPAGVNHLRITRNEFSPVNDAKSPTIEISGDDCEIDHNYFHDKHTEGCWVTVQGPGPSGMAQRTWIHHNEFNNFQPSANNCSAIQVGLSRRSLSSGHALVEYNLFIKCRGENEGMVCNKSCDNVYRFNTITDGTRELSLRHGNRCQVYGNYFFNVDGLRFFGHDHLIFSNYFEGCERAINIGNGDGIVPKDKLTSHDKPVGECVVFNTLVNNKANIVQQNRRNGLGADNVTIANNIIVGGLKAADIQGHLEKPVWLNNVIWKNTGGNGDMPATGVTTADPHLQQIGSIEQPQSDSTPKAMGHFPFVTIDLEGRPRGNTKTIGAEQPSDAQPLNHPLSAKEVGPLAP